MVSFISLFLRPSISNILKNHIKKRFIFGQENSNIWSESPGMFQNPTYVNLTFFHHIPFNLGIIPSNKFNNQKEKKKQELVEIFSITDLETQSSKIPIFKVSSTVQFNGEFQYSFHSHSNLKENSQSNPYLSISNDKNIRTLNFPMMSFWYKINHLEEDILYNSIFGQTYGELLKDDMILRFFINEILLFYKYLNDFDKTKKNIFTNTDVSDDQIRQIMGDSIMGIGNHSGLEFWFDVFLKKENDQVFIF
jgi:hypothetical protein